ncbi:MAG: galactose-1-epimerase [Eubacteriales bacterium]|nr:galactose-1-epimerase [Eubacteriales bacterium]
MDGREVHLYTLQNNRGMEAVISDLGGLLVRLYVPDRNGIARDVALGFDTPEEYLENGGFFGALVGPNANRIDRASYTLHGRVYQLVKNEGENNIHSDRQRGVHRRIWEAKEEAGALLLSLSLADGELGFPGNRRLSVRYELTEKNGLRITYDGESDQDTIFNLTNHSYFNLDGHGAGSIEDHRLLLEADAYTPVRADKIPTGEIAPVENTPLDFRSLKRIGERIGADDAQLKIAGGYDHNWVCNGYDGRLRRIALVQSRDAACSMEVYTDLPGVQFYSGNFSRSLRGKDGAGYGFRGGLALETQFYPDTPNQAAFPSSVFGPKRPYHTVTEYRFGNTEALDRRLVSVTPSHRQLSLMQTEFYAFVHFTVNTFTGREWGDGTEPETCFHPEKLDAAQWVRAVKAAGMRGLILTCKHHDGFCLWPSKYTSHSVAGSPWKDGRGDVVREAADACREGGIGFGVYLSPWDRNHPAYGSGKPYDDYFVHQLTELLTQYGPIRSVWFDGACGEGPNGKKQRYDWERYYETIRRLQPEACIHVCGPDIRWCGNEAGDTRASEWSVVPGRTRDTEKIASLSQQSDDTKFRQRRIAATDADLGSRAILAREAELIWYPAEVNTSIRPGWFYHAEEDGQVRTREALAEIYDRSVGGNATFLLNIPPTPDGLFHQNDVKRLEELGEHLRSVFSDNLLEQARLAATHQEPGHEIDCVREKTDSRYYRPADGVRDVNITAAFDKPVWVSRVVLKENVRLSQRIEAFTIEDETGRVLYRGTTVGYQKIAVFPKTKLQTLQIHITDARVCPTLEFVGVY